MTIQENIDQQLIDSGSEPLSNLSSNAHMADIIQARFSRRTVLQGTLGAAAVGFLGASLSGCGGDSSSGDASKNLPVPRVTFDAIPISRADTITLPDGYQ